jgi:hypothetical protein
MASAVPVGDARALRSPHTFLGSSPLVRSPRVLARLGLLLLAIGVVCRAVRYLLQFPFWGDEGYVLVNFLDRDYLALTKTLDCCQVAPILFLWGEATAYRLLGGAEWAMRLLPFLASVGGLLLFWRLARLTLPPRAAAFAVGLMAVARWPVTMGAVVKPYSFDLFFALALLVPAVQWLIRPERKRWLALLVAVVPVALAGSYPAAFVAGAVSVALLPAVWRNRSAGVVALYLAYNVLMTVTFLGCFLLIGREQLDPAAGSVYRAMLEYWADGFPPSRPWPLLRWFVAINTGRLMAYPAGDSNGGSALTTLLFLVGAWRFWKDGRRAVLVLCLVPFALNLFAAVLHRYPYGGCCRLSQHLAPAVCLLAGCGAAALVERFARTPVARARATFGVCGLLALCGAAQPFIDAAHPYREEEALWCRKVSDEVIGLAAPNDRVVVVTEPIGDWALLRWQLMRRGRQISWNGGVDWERLNAEGGRLWLVSPHMGDQPRGDVTPPGLSGGWVRVEQARFTLRYAKPEDPTRWCTLSCWERADRTGTSPPPVISSWP